MQLSQKVIASIDSYIRNGIIALNKAGYKTLFSCSGIKADHLDRRKENGRPYLVIHLDSLSIDEIKEISVGVFNFSRYSRPEPQEIKKDNNGVIQVCRYFYSLKFWNTALTALVDINDKEAFPVLSFDGNKYDDVYIDGKLKRTRISDKKIMKQWDKLFQFLIEVKTGKVA